METWDRIRDARQRAGLTQAELAKLVGVSKTTVGNWETGKHPPELALGRLREVLNLDENLMSLGRQRSPQLSEMSPQELMGRFNLLLAELNSISVEVSRRLAQGVLETSQAPRHAHDSPGAVFYSSASDGTDESDHGKRA